MSAFFHLACYLGLSCYSIPFSLPFLKNRFYLLLERREGKRGREASMCGCLSHGPRWGPGLQPRHVLWLGIELATLWFTVRAQSTELHQPGLLPYKDWILFHCLFILSSADGHLSCFPFGAVIAYAATNIRVQVSVQTCFQFSRVHT